MGHSLYSIVQQVRSSYVKLLVKIKRRFTSTYSEIRSYLRRFFHLFKSGFNNCIRSYEHDRVVTYLIAANGAVFILWQFADRQFMHNHFSLSIENIAQGRLHTMITCAFSHRSIGHLNTNMISLFAYGPGVRREFGTYFFLKNYLCGAFVGSIFYLAREVFIALVHGGILSRALGASAAVNTIALVNLFLLSYNKIYFNNSDVPARLLGFGIIAQDIWTVWKGDLKVSGIAHLGGAFVALISWLLATGKQ